MIFESEILKDVKHISQAAAEEYEYIKGRNDNSIQSLLTPWKKYNDASMNGIEFGSIHCCAGMSGKIQNLCLSLKIG